MSSTTRKKWKKIGYKFNPIIDEIQPPQVLLVNRRLERIGELTNVQDFRYTLKEYNQANEISFTYYKTQNDVESPFYDRVDDLSVVYVDGEFFEIAISNHEDAAVTKNVTGVSLGYAELSQILMSLEVNTDADLDMPIHDEIMEYNKTHSNNAVPTGTAFYRPIESGEEEPIIRFKKATSLLDRIVSETPHYKIGHVDETLYYMQREFSWSNTDIVSILNAIAEEISCAFDIVVRYDENGNAERIINAYDLQYCDECYHLALMHYIDDDDSMIKNASGDYYRNIVNGVCQTCGKSQNIKGLGVSTPIFISTRNISNEITVDGNKDEIKTAFKIEGGDDLMTDTVQGLNMSTNNRVMIIPDYMQKNMSGDLYNAYQNYRDTYVANEEKYKDLLEAQYNIYDLINYLKDGKMPVSDEQITTIDKAFYKTITKCKEAFSSQAAPYYTKFYIDTEDNFSTYSAKSTVEKLLRLFIPEGFSVSVDMNTEYMNQNDKRFDGVISIYKTSDKGDCIRYSIRPNPTQESWSLNLYYGDEGTTAYTGYSQEQLNQIYGFIPEYCFGKSNKETYDQSDVDAYREFIEQYCATLLDKNDVKYENEKQRNWGLYSLKRLESFASGYETCIVEMQAQKGDDDTYNTEFAEQVCDDIINSYNGYLWDINTQMQILKEEIYALETYLGEYDSDYLDENNTPKKIKFSHFNNKQYAFVRIGFGEPSVDNNSNDKYVETERIGKYPCKCKRCLSTNVSIDSNGVPFCRNCSSNGADIYTYEDMAKDTINLFFNTSYAPNIHEIVNHYYFTNNNHYHAFLNHGSNIVGAKKSMQEDLDIINVFKKKLKEDHRSWSDDTVNEQAAILYNELMSYIREDVYSNSNYTSDALTNTELIQKAQELQNKAIRELSKACMPQYSVTMNVGSIIAQKPYEYNGETYNEDYANFAVNNFVHAQIDDEILKMRVSSIELSYPPTSDISVTFTNAERYIDGTSSDIADILANAQSMATSYSYIETQSEQGKVAYNEFNKLKKDGLDTALTTVTSGINQDVLIDGTGITLRKYNEFADTYYDHQMKLVNNVIVMTDDGWNSARMAIGLVQNPDPDTRAATPLLYGVYADAIVGDLVVTKKMKVTNENNTVTIDENGITLDGGHITWTQKIPTSDIDGINAYATTSYVDGTYVSNTSLSTTLSSYVTTTALDGRDYATHTNLNNLNTTLSENINTVSTNLGNLQNSLIGTDGSVTALQTFQTNLTNCLTKNPTTVIGQDTVIAPYIGGGYLNITGNNNTVLIDPNLITTGNTNVVMAIKHRENNRDNIIFAVQTNGNLTISGEINAKTGYIGDGTKKWNIGSSTTDSYIYNGYITNGKIDIYATENDLPSVQESVAGRLYITQVNSNAYYYDSNARHQLSNQSGVYLGTDGFITFNDNKYTNIKQGEIIIGNGPNDIELKDGEILLNGKNFKDFVNNDLVIVEKTMDINTIAAGDEITDKTLNVTIPAGQIPIGIVGWWLSGINYTWCIVSKIYFSSSSNQIICTIHNTKNETAGSSSYPLKLHVNMLFKKQF